MAAGVIAIPVKSRGRSRHVPASERVVAGGASAGAEDRRPLAVLDNPHSLFQLWTGLKARCPRTGRGEPDETEASRGEHLAREARSPLGSPSCLGDSDQRRESLWMPGGDGTLRA